MVSPCSSSKPAVGLRIVATASHLPGAPVSSAAIDARAGVAEGTCQKRLKIHQRHFAGEESSGAMAVTAARTALDRAGWTAEDLDLIVSAGAVMEQWIPTQAVLIQQALGLSGRGTPVLDINATCLSFLAALDAVSWGLAAGRYRRVLIVSADVPSRALDWDDLDVCGNFGDGAAAVLVERDETAASGILAARFQTHSEGARLCELRSGGSLTDLRNDPEGARRGAVFRMEGVPAYRLSARHFPAFLDGLLAEAGVTIQDVAAVIPHQASALALHHLRRLSGIPAAKVVDIFSRHGNQVAASLPTALDHAVRIGTLKRGDLALLVGTAAGVTLGGMVVRV